MKTAAKSEWGGDYLQNMTLIRGVIRQAMIGRNSGIRKNSLRVVRPKAQKARIMAKIRHKIKVISLSLIRLSPMLVIMQSHLLDRNRDFANIARKIIILLGFVGN